MTNPIPDCIISILTDGGTLTVGPHDVLNPQCGFSANIATRKWRMSANGDTPAQAIYELAALLSSGVAL